MSISFTDELAVINDVAGIDDAEPLLAWLQSHPQAGVDLSACSHLHACCLQALMAAGARINAFPTDAPFAGWLHTVLNTTTKESETP